MGLEWLERIRGYLMPYPYFTPQLGPKGEYLARRYFHRMGYHVRHRNWTHGKGEIDLIMANSRKIVFVEVKTRQTHTGRGISDVLRYDQEQRLKQLAAIYLSKQGCGQVGWEFQLVYIVHRHRRDFVIQTARIC